MSRETVVKGGPSGFLQRISIGPHQLLADEPKDARGNDAGPNPYELLLASLGACTSMTLRMYADRKGWQLEEVRVVLTHSRSYGRDCAECEKKAAMIDRVERQIALVGELSGEQRERLLEIADRCPVHRTLSSRIQIETRLADPSRP
jgi:putative redox protein